MVKEIVDLPQAKSVLKWRHKVLLENLKNSEISILRLFFQWAHWLPVLYFLVTSQDFFFLKGRVFW